MWATAKRPELIGVYLNAAATVVKLSIKKAAFVGPPAGVLWKKSTHAYFA